MIFCTYKINGFLGPIRHYRDATNLCVNGDRVLIRNRTYRLKSNHQISNNIYLIGIQNDVRLQLSNSLKLIINGNTYIENVTLQIHCGSSIYVRRNSKLWLKNCIIESGGTVRIIAKNASVLNVENCTFMRGQIGIEITPLARSVNIPNCTLKNMGAYYKNHPEVCGCIKIFDQYNEAEW
eukprot:135068_1